MKSAFLLIVMLLAGCASIKKGDPVRDKLAKEFKVNPSKSSIYIYRNEGLGAAISKDVFLNSKKIGSTGPYSYFWLEVSPGQYKIDSSNDSSLTLDAKKGKIYYVWQEMKMGAFVASSKLQIVNDADGKKGVKESKLIQEDM